MKTIQAQSTGRIDQYLAQELQESRSQIQARIKKGTILVNGAPVKNNYIVKEQDQITIEEVPQTPVDLVPEPMDLDIVYEDDDLLVVNKQNGLVVHPGAGNTHGTLANGLFYHIQSLSHKDTIRPGIVHRIDADTTGLLMVAKNEKAHESLAKQLEEKTTHRKYLALVHGVLETDTGTIDAPIGRDPKDRKKMAVVANGKPAITHFKVIERYFNATLIEVVLETGRTHQIRVHMNYIGHPVVNDPVYGRRKCLDESGQCLHAMELGFHHPSNNQYLEFQAPIPPCFQTILEQFKDS